MPSTVASSFAFGLELDGYNRNLLSVSVCVAKRSVPRGKAGLVCAQHQVMGVNDGPIGGVWCSTGRARHETWCGWYVQPAVHPVHVATLTRPRGGGDLVKHRLSVVRFHLHARQTEQYPLECILELLVQVGIDGRIERTATRQNQFIYYYLPIICRYHLPVDVTKPGNSRFDFVANIAIITVSRDDVHDEEGQPAKWS